VGHSERRHVFGETDGWYAGASVFAHAMLPIVCIGELLNERDAGRTFEVVGGQVEKALQGLDPGLAGQLVLAYEPVWAIGTGRTASPGQAQEVHAFIRQRLESLFNKEIANRVRILYGGSVKPDNVDALMAEPDLDGMLVGGASLDAASFRRIVQFHSQEK
jgi:triosephosphate isomerase